MFLDLFLKAISSSIYVRHFVFGQCIGYIVSNKPADRFLKFSILSF